MVSVIDKYQRDGFRGLIRGGKAHVLRCVQDGLTSHIHSLHSVFYTKPANIFIEATNACNLACEMCYSGKREKGFMDLDLFKHVVDEVAVIGNVCVFLHFGGETLLHPAFLEMLEYVMSKHERLYNVGFFTNGMLLTESVSSYIVKHGLDWITVSMDGIGKVQERIRRKSDYNTVAQNLDNLISLRGDRRKPRVFINVTISTQTEAELAEIWCEWHNKVDSISYQGRINESFKILDLQRWKTIDPARARFASVPFCSAAFYQLIVLWNGDVAYCCLDLNAREIIGNAKSTSLMDIWKSEKLNLIRKHILSRKFNDEQLCGKCQFFNGD